jgi:uncharacterized protein YjbJ (UPF0337 family)
MLMETLLKIAITSQPARNVSILQKLVCGREIQRRAFMGSVADKIKGNANEAIGKAKQGVGEATGSDRLQGEGAVQEIKGKGQKALGDAKEATKDAINKAADAANRKL